MRIWTISEAIRKTIHDFNTHNLSQMYNILKHHLSKAKYRVDVEDKKNCIYKIRCK